MAIEKFVTGKYYRFMGDDNQDNWNVGGKMDFVLDHRWRKCLYGKEIIASFEGDPLDHVWYWSGGLELWEESDFPMVNQVYGNIVDLRGILVSCPKNKPSVFIKKRRKLVYIKIKD